ncbi:ATPase family AAA domain-containing protein At1g05910-like isoform X1 [Salvia miltiorrhiza]|uniref:ATPase family AAA domain-containing protein At1g05910-like isoform X1 n=1 Tax=Salvia miltiorrhiza TaxID=226208 RepID=UPI0025AC09A0|nr:ATPase family AAA domain-containing protein At1g05910-like isoform X1 [Salvia miltiorrhiza]XP_057793419.1 ATPase family AAA domain-containing protein At1g05910-like isoform X1 [Salvia miltiorrhiza]
MFSKGSVVVDGPDSRPVRTSDRLKSRTRHHNRRMYYTPNIVMRSQKKKPKKRASSSHLAKIFQKERTSSKANSVDANLRRSTRKRRMPMNLEEYTDSSGTEGEDNDLMMPRYQRSRNRINNNIASQDELTPRREGLRPRREGLRPRRSRVGSRKALRIESEEEQSTSDEKGTNVEPENAKDMEDNDADDGEGEEEGAGEEDGEDEEEDGDDEEGEEQEGRRRYDLRNRADVRRLSIEQSKQMPRSPRRVLHQGMGSKVGRDARRGSSRVHKRHRMTRAEDSDDSLLVDELDQGPPIPWGRGGSRSAPPWLLGGLDIQGTTSWGLNVAASGWGHQNDTLSNLSSGIQTAGPSSKGGADIQPVQIDETVSFDDIGGLSEYIDALKEMVFFPLLYPDFFASYNITPPRGVLLCGPPGTGKTLIARALACAASKAGQKVSFYMRKGADVLSKWVGEAERQLKLLFEEAQKNQPSIIFFDEIDGLAPVRSSKQEQIHNSIVSTLLALMDGLDSRGQVVLIGATNRVDAIDGALRRPGRFDREFNFPLPGCEARAEILDIHTRKWKEAPSKELKLELASSCVGYCGADLKALCTEAAIRAFRERYPQVYTSDDKFLIDVDSVKVEKYHFVEAMTTITPAAHRGSIVNSRPLSPVVFPCLQRLLKKAMSIICDIFPVVSSDTSKLSMLSYGSAISLVYRPRLLLCGDDGVGLDHLGPAVLHELEKFPVHSLALPSLLSDPGAKTPEEALVHVFGEARRTTPSILYLPQFHLWWESAHDQLKAVLRTLLEELPSGLPILLLGTSSIPLAEICDSPSIFSDRHVLHLSSPLKEDRSLFFDRLIEAALSVQSENLTISATSKGLPELPKAPKVATGPKVSELRAKAEAQGHALRRLRMCLRDVCNRILYDKRFSAFHYPVSDEDAPNYHAIIQNPMDVATLLQRVDSGKYITCKSFVEDFDLILANAKKYNGDDYNGSRIVSRAYELRDSVHGMLSQMDPSLVTFCDKIAEEGGPISLPVDDGTTLPQSPVIQMMLTTRASARLRNVQPEVNLDQSCEPTKKPKKQTDASQAEEGSDLDLDPPKAAEEAEANCTEQPTVETPVSDSDEQPGNSNCDTAECTTQDVTMSCAETSDQVDSIKKLLLDRSKEYNIPQLERLYTSIMKGVFETKDRSEVKDLKASILRFLFEFAEDQSRF